MFDINTLVPAFTKPQRIALALLTTCILIAHSLVLAELARAFPPSFAARFRNDHTAHKHMLKRVGRLLGNKALASQRLIAALARLSIALALQTAQRGCYPGLRAPDGRHLLPVLVDYTEVEDRFVILRASVLWVGRALPVLSRAFCWADLHAAPDKNPVDPSLLSQNKLEDAFLAGLLAVLPRLPEGWSYVLVFDRGFPREGLLTQLEQWRREHSLHPEWAIRLPLRQHLLYQGQSRDTRSFRVGFGERGWWANVGYRKGEGAVGNLLVAWEVGPDGKIPKQGWRVLTSLCSPGAAFGVYYARMQVEQDFRDQKHLLGLERSGVGVDRRLGKGKAKLDSARLQRLLAGLQLAHLALAALGDEPHVQAVAGRLLRLLTAEERRRGRAARGSRIFLALKILREPWHVPEEALHRAWDNLQRLAARIAKAPPPQTASTYAS
jgi:hypothetical protein